MDGSGNGGDGYRSSPQGSGGGGRSRYGLPFSAAGLIQAPLTSFLEYAGVIRTGRSSHPEAEVLVEDHAADREDGGGGGGGGGGEVSIRIIGAGEPAAMVVQGREEGGGEVGDVGPPGGEGAASSSSLVGANGGEEGEQGNGAGAGNRDSSYQRYDIQQVARWIEQILPFSLLLLVVFIRQHLQGIGSSSISNFWLRKNRK